VSHELYRRYRPAKLEDVVGQDDAVRQLRDWLKRKRVPHALLLSGPSGVGKTTIARILRKELNCSKNDFYEINAAESRGIDTVREVQGRMGLSPLGGDCRIWLFDEAHQLTRREGGDAQTALLKTLEDTPDHVYFILATTNPNGLLPTIQGRCSQLTLKPIPERLLVKMMEDVMGKHDGEHVITGEVYEKIAEAADGSARKALVILNQVMGLETEEDQLKAVARVDAKKTAFQLAQALIWSKASWKEIAGVIAAIEDTDWEGMRQLVMACASKELLNERNGKPSGKAFIVLDVFKDSWFYTGRNGLVWACCEVFRQKA
jgi:DNA polymerase-3 subunit gamma/tau